MKIAFIWIFYMVIMGRIRGEVEMNRVVFVINVSIHSIKIMLHSNNCLLPSVP